MELGSYKVFLLNYLYYPQLGVNLLAVNKLDDNNIHVLFANKKATLYQNNRVVATVYRQGRLYILEVPRELVLYIVANNIWHMRMAYTNLIVINSL